jgi:hypothetical protein
MSDPRVVLHESRDRVAVITINRPAKANARTPTGRGLAARRRFNAGYRGDWCAKVFPAARLDAPPELRRFMPGVGIAVE